MSTLIVEVRSWENKKLVGLATVADGATACAVHKDGPADRYVFHEKGLTPRQCTALAAERYEQIRHSLGSCEHRAVP